MPNSWSLSNPCTNRGLCPDKPAIGRFVAKGMPPDYVRDQMAPTGTGRNLRRSGDRDSSRFGWISPQSGSHRAPTVGNRRELGCTSFGLRCQPQMPDGTTFGLAVFRGGGCGARCLGVSGRQRGEMEFDLHRAGQRAQQLRRDDTRAVGPAMAGLVRVKALGEQRMIVADFKLGTL